MVLKYVRASWINDEGDQVEIAAELSVGVIADLVKKFDMLDQDEDAESLEDTF